MALVFDLGKMLSRCTRKANDDEAYWMQMNGRFIGRFGGCEVARKPGAFCIRFVAG